MKYTVKCYLSTLTKRVVTHALTHARRRTHAHTHTNTHTQRQAYDLSRNVSSDSRPDEAVICLLLSSSLSPGLYVFTPAEMT